MNKKNHSAVELVFLFIFISDYFEWCCSEGMSFAHSLISYSFRNRNFCLLME